MLRFALPLLMIAGVSAAKSSHYSVRFPNAVHHEAEIKITFSGIETPDLEVVMSRSSPGRYALAEFAKNIYHVRAATDDGRALPLTHPDPYSWRVTGHHGTVVFSYTLFGNHADGTYAAIDETHAHLNMPAAFAWARGFSASPFVFTFEVPAGSEWKIATQLLANKDGSYSAPNLEQMMDSPVELSNHTQVDWRVEDALFRLALHHTGTKAEAREYARMCQKIVLEEEGVFGALPKYDNGSYTFLADFLPYASGDGMEHRDSTVMTSSSDLHTSMRKLAGTASHEFFHSWNVRRIRPRSLEPFDFERANMSGELWFAEGFTNYYGLLALERSGLDSLDEFVSAMGRGVDAVLTSPGRKVHSAVGMSELAPFVDAARSVDETNFTDTFISYYTYGQALALGIDLAIRDQFPGKSLDDWMQTMWREHPDIQRPYTLTDLRRTLAEVTGSREFADSIFDRHVEGVEPIDYAKLLRSAGLELRPSHAGQPWVGLRSEGGLAPASGGLEIRSEPLAGSPFYEAGLESGDILLKWGGKQVGSGQLTDLSSLLANHRPGDRVAVEATTRAGQKRVSVLLAENPHVELVTFERAGKTPDAKMQELRKSWLSSKALHSLPK